MTSDLEQPLLRAFGKELVFLSFEQLTLASNEGPRWPTGAVGMILEEDSQHVLFESRLLYEYSEKGHKLEPNLGCYKIRIPKDKIRSSSRQILGTDSLTPTESEVLRSIPQVKWEVHLITPQNSAPQYANYAPLRIPRPVIDEPIAVRFPSCVDETIKVAKEENKIVAVALYRNNQVWHIARLEPSYVYVTHGVSFECSFYPSDQCRSTEDA